MVKKIEKWATDYGMLYDTEAEAQAAELQHALSRRLFDILVNENDLHERHVVDVLDVLLKNSEARGILRMYAGSCDNAGRAILPVDVDRK